jgi:hypothetical protein
LELAQRLSRWTGLPVDFFRNIRNPKEFWALKTEAIDWKEHAEGRPWVWIEDEILSHEKHELRKKKAMSHWIPCFVSRNPKRLLKVWRIISTRFNIPLPENILLDKIKVS